MNAPNKERLFNSVCLVGRAGHDTEIKYFERGDPFEKK